MIKVLILIAWILAVPGFTLWLISCGPPKSSHIQLGAPTRPPSGWEQFCRDNPTDPMCQINRWGEALMPRYRNDGKSAKTIAALGGPRVLFPGEIAETYCLYEDLTKLAEAPYWSPAVSVHQPAGNGDLDPITLDPHCHSLDVWNNSPAAVSVKLRAAAATAVVLPGYTSRRICAPAGLALSDVADQALLNVSEEITAGQLVVTQLRREG